jgi:peptidoglycan-associated lipoprotein
VVPVDDSRSRPVPTPSDNPDRTFDLTPVEGLPTTENRDLFAANTVYFDFDRSTIKASERSKVEAVSKHLLANPTHGVKIEGHCDERGTEGYNLSLGERRALAIREYLVNLGVPADKVTTISFGEARPAETGHDESAWRKNRRGEFILLTP